MSVGTALSRTTGFVRLAAMTYALGVSVTRLADTYNVANTTPNIIYELALGGVLSSVFVPVFVDWTQTRGRDEAWGVAHRIMTLTVVSLSAIALLGIVAAPAVIRLYTAGGGSDPAADELAGFFLRWFMPQIVFYGVGAVATGLLNAHRRFAAPMFAPILNNLVAIATFLTYSLLPADSDPVRPESITDAQKLVLAIGTTLGIVAMTLALWPSLRRIGWRWRWDFRWGHEAVGRIAHLAKWTAIYVVLNQIGLLIVIRLAYLGGRGDYSAYIVAFTMFQLPHAIFAVSIFTALLPAMAGRWSDGDTGGYRTLLSQGIRTNAAIIIPAVAGYIALALPIVRLLFQRGETTPQDAELIASVLVPMALGLFPFSLFQLLLRAFYGMQDTRTPALINIGAVGVQIGTSLVLYFAFDLGVQGLAVALAAAYAFASSMALWIIRRRIHGADGRRVGGMLMRVLAAAAATGIAAWGAAAITESLVGATGIGARWLIVVAGVGAGLLVFGLSALILRIEEVDTVRRGLMARLRR
jgi:putative peptidoglycan lipid II flippase